MSETSSDYQRWRDTEASRLIACGRVDTEIVRALLILSCHSSAPAKRFFEERLGNEELLGVLLGLAVGDYSGDAQMTASYWVSRFPPGMLAAHVSQLEAVASNEWDSVSFHARGALNAIRASGS